MFGDDDPNLQYEQPSALQRYGVPGGIVVVATAVIGFGAYSLLKSGPAPRPHQEQPHILNIKLPPPPPPPPPPPKQEPQKQEEKQQQKMEQPKPQAPKPPPEPPSGLTAKAGNGPDAFGLGVGSGEGDVGGGGGGDATEYANYYKSAIANKINDTLHRSDRLRDAVYRLTVAISFDGNGRAASVVVQDFSGNDDDRAEVERILRSLSVNENLPATMTGGRPWVVRINSHEPG